MPKGLVLGAIIAVVVLIALMSWLNSRALQPDEPAANVAAAETKRLRQPPLRRRLPPQPHRGRWC